MLLVHSGRFPAWTQEREWKVMELNVTLLFECVLQGNVVYRRLVQRVNCWGRDV